MGIASHSPVLAAPFQSAPLFRRADVTLKTLPNGVRTLFKSAPGSDVVAIQVWVRAGSRYELAGQSGAAHLLETAATTASQNFPAREDDDGGLSGAIRGLGGDAGSLTSRDATFYSATVAPIFAANATKALADAVLRPVLAPAAVEEAKSRAANDLAGRSFDAVSLATDLAYGAAYAKNPYRRPAWGTEASLANLNAKIVRDFHKRLYVGANISVVIVGDLAKADAQKIMASAFASAPKGSKASVKVAPETAAPTKLVSRTAGFGRDAVALAWRSPGIDKPQDVVSLDTLLALWREGADAVLRQKLLRDGLESATNGPLTGSYDVDFLTQNQPGLFLVTLGATVDKDEAIKAVTAEIERVRAGLSEAETQKARDLLRRQYIEQGENAGGQAGALGFYEMISNYQFALDYLSRCATVSSADLARVAKTYLAADKLIRTEVTPLRRPQPEIPKPGDEPVITVNYSLQTEVAR